MIRCFPNCTKSWWIKLLFRVVDRHPTPRICFCLEEALITKNVLSHMLLSTHSIHQGGANVFNRKVICRKPKTPPSRTTTLWQYKYCKECKFYIKWCAVIANTKLLFDFLVPENPDSTLLKMCELFLPSVHFSRLHDGPILWTSLQRNKILSNMMCYRLMQKWVVHWSFIFWGFTFWNLLPEINCRAALTKVFLGPIFLHFGSLISVTVKCVTNGGGTGQS